MSIKRFANVGIFPPQSNVAIFPPQSNVGIFPPQSNVDYGQFQFEAMK